MKKFLSIFLFGILLFVGTISEVIEANDKNFNELINTNQVIAFLWLEPEGTKNEKIISDFTTAAQILQKDHQKMKFATINSNDAKITVDRIKIQKFPYFSIFLDGKTFIYDSGYRAEDFVNYIMTKLNPPIVKLKTPEEVENLVKLKEAFVFVGETDKTNQQWISFQHVTSSFDDVLFAACGTMDCIIYFNIGYDSVLFIKDYANQRREIVNWEPHALRTFIRENRAPIFETFDLDAAKQVFSSYAAGLVLYRDADEDDQKHYDLIFKRAAKNLKGAIYFVITDIKGDIPSQIAFTVRIKTEDLPVVYIHDARKEEIKHYRFDKEITESNLNQFTLDWLSGKLTPYYKKEAPPETQTYPVLTAVRDTYEDIVIKNDNDVFVLFVAPKCPYCKPLESDFEKLAQMLRKTKRLVFVKINAYDNEIEQPIESYPTLMLYRNSEKYKPLTYTWKKEVGQMLDFLKTYLGYEFELSIEDAEIDAHGIDPNDFKIEI
jgi:protein disulfide isomerase